MRRKSPSTPACRDAVSDRAQGSRGRPSQGRRGFLGTYMTLAPLWLDPGGFGGPASF
jgi:hypothetical protein